jgi:RimJ/RimL family protein N-acetyltransferase
MSQFSLPILRTKRCTLRPWQISDTALLPAIADTRLISWNTSYKFPSPFGEEEAKRFVSHHIKENSQDNWLFAIDFENKLIGGCSAHRGQDVQAHTAEIGYWLGPDYWSKGLATEVVVELIKYITAETDVEQLTANCFGWSPASTRVLEKAGFNKEGVRRGVVKKWNRRTDLIIFGKLLR